MIKIKKTLNSIFQPTHNMRDLNPVKYKRLHLEFLNWQNYLLFLPQSWGYLICEGIP